MIGCIAIGSLGVFCMLLATAGIYLLGYHRGFQDAEVMIRKGDYDEDL